MLLKLHLRQISSEWICVCCIQKMESVVRETLIQCGLSPFDSIFDTCFKRLCTITETFVRVCCWLILWLFSFFVYFISIALKHNMVVCFQCSVVDPLVTRHPRILACIHGFWSGHPQKYHFRLMSSLLSHFFSFIFQCFMYFLCDVMHVRERKGPARTVHFSIRLISLFECSDCEIF